MTRTDDLTVAEALARVLGGVSVLPAEQVAISEALGRVLASAVVAQDDLPPFANSAMDGYAVRAADVASAGKSRLLSSGLPAISPPGSLRIFGLDQAKRPVS
jgi:molybdopterin molybdotransferase